MSYVTVDREEIPDWVKSFVQSSDVKRVARVELDIERDVHDIFNRLKDNRLSALRVAWHCCQDITHRSDIQEQIESLPSDDWSDYNVLMTLYDIWPDTAEEVVRCARKIKGDRSIEKLIAVAQKRIDTLKIIERYLRSMHFFWGEDYITDYNNDLWTASKDNVLKSYVGDFLSEFKKLSEKKEKSTLLIELSRESINDISLWQEKINYMGNDHSCWRPNGAYEMSSEWFGYEQEYGTAFAVYFYSDSPEVQSGYELNGFKGFGRLWAINNSDGSDIQYINPYSTQGGYLSCSSLLGLVFPAAGYRIDYIDHCNDIIYINGPESYHARDNYDLDLIPASISDWIACCNIDQS